MRRQAMRSFSLAIYPITLDKSQHVFYSFFHFVPIFLPLYSLSPGLFFQLPL